MDHPDGIGVAPLPFQIEPNDGTREDDGHDRDDDSCGYDGGIVAIGGRIDGGTDIFVKFGDIFGLGLAKSGQIHYGRTLKPPEGRNIG